MIGLVPGIHRLRNGLNVPGSGQAGEVGPWAAGQGDDEGLAIKVAVMAIDELGGQCRSEVILIKGLSRTIAIKTAAITKIHLVQAQALPSIKNTSELIV